MDNNFNEINMLENLLKAIGEEDGYNLDSFNKEYANLEPNQNVKIGHSVKFINESNNADPEYATEGAAGFDFRANLNKEIKLSPGEYTMVPTGLYFELPEYLELQVRPRSGLAAKYGVTVLNSPGTVDSDYRGEVKVMLINHGKDTFTIQNGERVAQGVLSNAIGKTLVNFDKVDSLNETNRGEGGFGSTGIK